MQREALPVQANLDDGEECPIATRTEAPRKQLDTLEGRPHSATPSCGSPLWSVPVVTRSALIRSKHSRRGLAPPQATPSLVRRLTPVSPDPDGLRHAIGRSTDSIPIHTPATIVKGRRDEARSLNCRVRHG
jgi:hypothetical protein